MPDFWQFPTVSMGLGPIMAIYHARFLQVSGASRPARHQPVARVVLRRRRRMRRAGNPGGDHARLAGTAGQFDLCHQLQPAAARRPGSRQRQDHPGTRSRVPRGRLELHQSHLGQRLGSAAGGRPRRPSRQTHGRGRGRAVSEILRGIRRLHPQAFLRRYPEDCRNWSPISPTKNSTKCAAAGTIPKKSMRRSRRRSIITAGRR